MSNVLSYAPAECWGLFGSGCKSKSKSMCFVLLVVLRSGKQALGASC